MIRVHTPEQAAEYARTGWIHEAARDQLADITRYSGSDRVGVLVDGRARNCKSPETAARRVVAAGTAGQSAEVSLVSPATSRTAWVAIHARRPDAAVDYDSILSTATAVVRHPEDKRTWLWGLAWTIAPEDAIRLAERIAERVNHSPIEHDPRTRGSVRKARYGVQPMVGAADRVPVAPVRDTVWTRLRDEPMPVSALYRIAEGGHGDRSHLDGGAA